MMNVSEDEKGTTTSTSSGTSKPLHLLVGVVVAALAGLVWKMEEEYEGIDATWFCCVVILSALMFPYLAAKTVSSSSSAPSQGAPLALLQGKGKEEEDSTLAESSCCGEEEYSVLQGGGAEMAAITTNSTVESDTTMRALESENQEVDHKTTFTEEEIEKRIANYINGRIIYADGSPAAVPAGESADELPSNFLKFYNGNEKQATKKWLEHQQWRTEKEVWKIHTKPDPCFDTIKEAYPHVAHGRSKQGWVVMYEHPGRMNMAQMFHSTVKPEDILHHDIFILEYCANVLHKPTAAKNNNSSSDWGMMGVLDLTDLKMSEFLSREVFGYLSMISKVNDDHYPLHVKKVFMIHAPFWLAGAFKIIKPVLPPSVNVEIYSSDNYKEALREYIDDDQLPVEFGGSSPYKLGEHPMELDLYKLARMGADSRNRSSENAFKNETARRYPNKADTENTVVECDSAVSAAAAADDDDQPKGAVVLTSTKVNSIATLPPLAARQWPSPLKHLPSLCSTSFTASSDEDEGKDDDNDVSFDSQRSAFLMGKGPLRPRLPSFEPVLDAEEEKRVIATFYSSSAVGATNRKNKGTNSPIPERQDDEDGQQETVACGDIVWTTLLSACS